MKYHGEFATDSDFGGVLVQEPAGRTPCSDFVHRCGVSTQAFEEGYLSLDHGFLSPTEPPLHLPRSHQAWDEAVRQVPRRAYTEETRGSLDQLALLPSDLRSLPDEALPRAATVLSILACAYWRHGLNRALSPRTDLVEDALPVAILRPWIEVNERLGRGSRPFQNVYDLFLNNFRLRSGRRDQARYRLDDVKVENLDVLTPSFGNEPERIFYMAFVEIHAIAAAIISAICTIEGAIAADSPGSEPCIVRALEMIEHSLRRCIEALRKIQPVRGNRTYCDPVLWAKTVATFAVPPSTYVQGGTSGTCTPFLFMMDALLSRDRYGSYYGKYVREEASRLLPSIHREFTRRVRGVPLKGYILGKMGSASGSFDRLTTAYNRVVGGYAGNGGFLDKHVSKALNYLGVATLVGRNQSTSGHERHTREETWNTVAAELKISLCERVDLFGAPALKERGTRSLSLDRSEQLPKFRAEQVARHHTPSDGWVILDGLVFDVTSFIERHPGGPAIVRGYLGRDITTPFSLVSAHHTAPVGRLLHSCLIGILEEGPDGHHPGRKALNALLAHLLRTHGLLALQYDQEAPEPQKTVFRMQAFVHFCKEHLPQGLAMILHLEPGCPPPLHLEEILLDRDTEMSQAEGSGPGVVHLLRQPSLWERSLVRSLSLLEELIAITISALETPAEPTVVQAQLGAALTRWRDALGRAFAPCPADLSG